MDNKQALRFQGVAMVVMLVVQYILGMTANLFAQFPKSTDAGQLWEYAWSNFSIAVHIIVGVLLLIGAVVLVIRAVMAKDKKWIIFSTIGLVMISIAGFSGAAFITTQGDIYSYLMSLSFIVALLAYFGGVAYSGK